MNRWQKFAVWLIEHEWEVSATRFMYGMRYWAWNKEKTFLCEFGVNFHSFNNVTKETKHLLKTVKNIELFKQDLIEMGYVKKSQWENN